MTYQPRIRRHHCAAALLLALGVASLGCDAGARSDEQDSRAESSGPRQIVALGRLEPAGGIISISAVPGERLKNFAEGVVEGASVAAGAELARVESFDLRQTQLEAAETKVEMAQRQRQRDRGAAEAQLEQAQASKAQTEAKYQETLAQQEQLQNLSEAAAIAQEDYQQLAKLQSGDAELVTDRQLRRRRNEADRAVNDYEAAAAAYPHALEAAKRAVDAAEANVKLARQNLELAEDLDQSVVAEIERRVAEQSRDQSVLRAPQVEGGSAQFNVLRIMLQPGEFVAQIPILEIGDVSRMVAIAEVYEADAKELFVGQSAVIRSPAFAGRYADGSIEAEGGIRGKVTHVGSMVASPGLTNRNPLAPSDRSVVEVRVEIDPADKEATAEAARRVGLQVTVEFGDKTQAAVEAPSTAGM
jgi:HlyD family secretion protein